MPLLALEVARDHLRTAALALELARIRTFTPGTGEIADALREYHARFAGAFEAVAHESFGGHGTHPAAELAATAYRDVKARLLAATARGEMTVSQLSDLLDRVRTMRELVTELEKGARRLAALRIGTSNIPSPMPSSPAEGPGADANAEPPATKDRDPVDTEGPVMGVESNGARSRCFTNV